MAISTEVLSTGLKVLKSQSLKSRRSVSGYAHIFLWRSWCQACGLDAAEPHGDCKALPDPSLLASPSVLETVP